MVFAVATCGRSHATFVRWCLEPRAARVDRVLHAYVQALFDAGRPKSVANTAFCALIAFYPGLRHALPWTRAAIKGWTSMVPVKSHAPLPPHFAALIAARLVMAGRLDAAAAVLLASHCLLRVSEVSNLRRQDLVLPEQDGDPRFLSSHGAVYLASTKTGKHQSVLIESAGVATVMRLYLSRCSFRGSDRLFPFSALQLNGFLRRGALGMGLPQSIWTWHSLRHGGAVALYMEGRPLDNIMVRGRWQAHNSVRTYLQAGRSILLASSFDAAKTALAADLFAELASTFSELASQFPMVNR